MEDMKQKAKMDVLRELHKTARDMMKEHMGDMGPGEGLKKVTVASPSTKGLEEGLEKAQGLVDDMPDLVSNDEEDKLEDHGDEMSPEQIDEEIRKLQEMKERLTFKD